ncbi:MAG: hypothetical protein LC105_07430 [Chitinophagales bacterium]|nr:hypothetical protein [Chitinophagales bacterium]
MIEKLIKIIHEEFPEVIDNTKDIEGNTPIQDIIPFTSLNMAILLTCIELEFDVTIKPIELRKCNTIDDLYQIIISSCT